MRLSKTYEPAQYESDIYKLWEQSGAFKADPAADKPRFSISMPPPNETGTLSIGHALFLTLQDIMTRHARQKGKDALWLPGTDHAAIAVNAIMEKKLSEEGTDKHTLGREEFLKRTKEFVAGSREVMTGQMRAMGASCDWSRLRYTLDESLNRAVSEVFVHMYEDGLIYRGNRIVNWDPKLQTTISDDELVYEEETAKFYTFKYGPFEIGTARPETKFGDKYVVMHPDDKRYADYKHGDTFEAEWINGPVTATVIKDKAVDPEFGTGVMTITPWHDHTDFEIAERHNLDKEQIIDFDGRLTAVAGEFAGMDIAEARPKIAEKLKQKGLLVNIDNKYKHNIALNDRGKGIVEPQIKLQWFVDVNKPVVDWKGKKRSLKEVMQAVINDGDIAIVPKRFEKTYFNWIDNLRDWCVSRQIWWGHQIPVWYKGEETYVGTTAPDGKGWKRDEDTLDTWFSSALWTWSTLLDPELAKDYSLDLSQLLKKSRDFQTYHPTTVMETGWDIIFFWVARMILSTTYATGQVPFKTVYLHGMVRAEDGKKMSKSRPESIVDPLSVIPEYGTDALRLALVMGVSPGNDQNWGTAKVETNRNFCNKLWNIARYTEIHMDKAKGAPEPKTLADHWIAGKLAHAIKDIDKDIDNFNFSGAYYDLYHLIWDDVADWYIEAGKESVGPAMLNYVLSTILKLLHPFAPFVTETIWQTLHPSDDSMLISSPWPEALSYDAEAGKKFEEIRAIVSEVRQIKTLLNLKGGELRFQDSELVFDNAQMIKLLTKLDSVSSVGGGRGLALTQTRQKCWLDIDESAARKLVSSLKLKVKELQKSINLLNDRLDNPGYVNNAPKKLVDETKAQLKQTEEEQFKLKDLLNRL
jgi:valyl-tRNA synthetase